MKKSGLGGSVTGRCFGPDSTPQTKAARVFALKEPRPCRYQDFLISLLYPAPLAASFLLRFSPSYLWR